MTTIGSICSGYGGLDLALMSVVGGSVAWHSEVDPGANLILDHHWPDVPNLGDLTATDWATVEPVDWLVGGYPCQPFSLAGKRKGSDDERHLWPHIVDAVGVLRPGWCLFENVAGHVTLGLDRVVWDLSALGYDSVWGVVRAADAGAPHGRARVFILAADAEGERLHGSRQARGRRPRLANDGGSPADAAGLGRGEGRTEPARRVGGPAPVIGCATATDTQGGRRQDVAWRDGGGPAVVGACAGTGSGVGAGHLAARIPELGRSAGVAWGPYAAAITRWERVTGRAAPGPTEPGRNGKPRLSAVFVEFLMGLPAGWVTDVPGLARTTQLKALGNGVVPQQAALAVRTLLPLMERSVAA